MKESLRRCLEILAKNMDSNFGKKMFSSFLTLTFRRAVLLALNFVTINLLLARILPVSVIGTFNIANAVLTFFGYFSDIGLAAALIQKKEIKPDDIKTTFTIQEILSFLVSVIAWFLAPLIANFYSLGPSGEWLVKALSISFFLTSLKVIPSILLERDLEFGKLVKVEVIEAVVFNGLLILLSFNNFSISAFSIAVLLRSISGVVLIYLINPINISLGISRSSAKVLLNFGVPFQLNSLLALLKDRLVPLVIAKMVGPLGIGYITWSQSIAFLPLEVMNIVTRITFPAYSRLQDNKEGLKMAVERSISLTALILYPLLFGVAAVARPFIYHLVSAKWQPALPLVYLFLFGAFWASLSVPSTNLLNAIGRIGTTLRLMVMWTLLEWGLTPVLTYYYGFYGVGFAYSIISISSLIPIYIIQRKLNIEIWNSIKVPLGASFLMFLVIFSGASYLVFNSLSLMVAIAVGGLFYILILLLFAKDKLLELRGIIK